ncbi:putative ribonuclease H-like domain-containing protein [Tanacetum coccineum]
MYYPRFTKVIIHHFLIQDKTLSWTNRIRMHTSKDDYLMNTLRFVLAKEATQIYGTILPKCLTSPEMKDSKAYKTYLGYATDNQGMKNLETTQINSVEYASHMCQFLLLYAKMTEVSVTSLRVPGKRVVCEGIALSISTHTSRDRAESEKPEPLTYAIPKEHLKDFMEWRMLKRFGKPIRTSLKEGLKRDMIVPTTTLTLEAHELKYQLRNANHKFSDLCPNLGNEGTAVKPQQDYNWRNSRPNTNSEVDQLLSELLSGHPHKNIGRREYFNSVLLKAHDSFDMKTPALTKDYACLIAKATSDESKLWHRRLGHINFKNLNKLVKGNLVRGLPSKVFKNDHTCVACQKGKQHRASCKAKLERMITEPLHTLHMDLFGPTSVKSINHASYCLVITDDCTRFSWVFFLATKDETSGILQNFIRQIKNQLNHRVKIIRSDNGTEFKNRDMLEFCGNKGIKQEYSNARTPQQNGVAERMNRTLIEAARTMLADSLLPTTFWAEAVSTACYIFNRIFKTFNTKKEAFLLALLRYSEILAFRRDLGSTWLKKHLREVTTDKATSTNSVNFGSEPANTQPADQDDSDMSELTIFNKPQKGIFDEASYDEEGMVHDFNNLPTEVAVSPIPTLRIHNIHHKANYWRYLVIGKLEAE